MINMKGGVGKTATSVNVAAYIASDYKVNVLLIDLDPQTNATFSLVSKEDWLKWEESHGTLYDIFDINATSNLDGEHIDVEDCIMSEVVPKIPDLDLLPSHIKTIDVEMTLARVPRYFVVLSQTLDKIKDDYDIIICDCPPNLSMLTHNGLFMSDTYIIPIEPDFLAAIGAEILRTKIEHIKGQLEITPELLGVVYTKVRSQETQMRRMKKMLDEIFGDKIFSTEIPKNNDVSKASEQSKPINLYRPKCKAALAYADLSEEIMDRLGYEYEEV